MNPAVFFRSRSQSRQKPSRCATSPAHRAMRQHSSPCHRQQLRWLRWRSQIVTHAIWTLCSSASGTTCCSESAKIPIGSLCQTISLGRWTRTYSPQASDQRAESRKSRPSSSCRWFTGRHMMSNGPSRTRYFGTQRSQGLRRSTRSGRRRSTGQQIGSSCRVSFSPATPPSSRQSVSGGGKEEVLCAKATQQQRLRHWSQ